MKQAILLLALLSASPACAGGIGLMSISSDWSSRHHAARSESGALQWQHEDPSRQTHEVQAHTMAQIIMGAGAHIVTVTDRNAAATATAILHHLTEDWSLTSSSDDTSADMQLAVLHRLPLLDTEAAEIGLQYPETDSVSVAPALGLTFEYEHTRLYLLASPSLATPPSHLRKFAHITARQTDALLRLVGAHQYLVVMGDITGHLPMAAPGVLASDIGAEAGGDSSFSQELAVEYPILVAAGMTSDFSAAINMAPVSDHRAFFVHSRLKTPASAERTERQLAGRH